MQNIAEQLGRRNLENDRAHPSIVTADALGVELELEGFTSTTITRAQAELNPYWTTTTDGSLRNGGVELITNGGMGGERLYAALERIVSFLSRHNYDASWRCSTHMHINMLDFTVPQVARFLMVYAACEPVLFAHCGPARYSSNFCVPVGDSLPFHKTLISRLYEDSVKTRSAGRNTVKYTALNLQPLFGDSRVNALGTVEFRGGRPMTTMDEFLLQANLLLSIKQFIRDTTDESENKMLTRLNEGVMNTVYANGCAAALNVPTEDLDKGIMHAWLLLKAYQQGMKTPRKETPAQRENVFAWQNAPTTPHDRGDGTPGPAFWNPAVDPAAMIPVETPRGWTLLAHSHYFREIGRGIERGSMEERMIRLSSMLSHDTRMSDDHSQSIGAFWYMIQMDREDSRHGPVGVQETYIRSWQGFNSMGNIPCVSYQHIASEQPRFTWGPARFNYRGDLNEEAWGTIVRATDGEVNSRFTLFHWLLNTSVRIKHHRRLLEAVQRAGFIDAQLPRLNSNGIYTMQAAMLMYWLRVADLNSEEFVHSRHLGVYDRVSLVVNLLHNSQLCVPFFKHYSQGGRGLIRCEVSLNSPLGHGITREAFSRISAQRRPRVSATTGVEVY